MEEKKTKSKKKKTEKAIAKSTERKQKKETKKSVKKERTAVPNVEPFADKAKRFLSSYVFLGTVFGILLVSVIVLFFLANAKRNEMNAKKSNILFSIIEKDTHNYIDLELQTLVGHQYALKVSNYRKDVLNTKGATYTLTITNYSDAEIEIQQDDNLENLMKDQKQTIIQGKKFSKTEKEERIYYFRVKADSEVKEGDKLRIEVDS